MEACACGTRKHWFILFSYQLPFQNRMRVFKCDRCWEVIERVVQVHLGSFLPRPELSATPKKVMWATELLFPSGKIQTVEHGR